MIKSDEFYVSFIQEIWEAEYNFMHRTVFGDSSVTETGSSNCEILLDGMKGKYPYIFWEPTHPFFESLTPLEFRLVDPMAKPSKHKLYPLSEPEL